MTRPLALLLLCLLQLATTAPAQETPDPHREDFLALRDLQRQVWRKINAGENVEADRRNLLAAADEYNLRHPNEPNGLQFAAEVATALGDDDAVDANYGRLLLVNPNLVRAGLAWAAYYYDSQPSRAEEILVTLLSDAPDNLAYSMALYEFYSKKMPTKLDERFDRIIQEAPSNELTGFLTGLGTVSPDLAVEFAERAKERWPEDPASISLLGTRLRWAARYEDAIEQFELLDDEILLRDDIGVAYADCLYATHRFTDAIAHLQAIEQRNLISDKKASQGVNFRLGTRPRMIQYWNEEQVIRNAEAERDDNPRATIVIDGTPVHVELFEDQAPVAVANFIHLADDGFYEGSDFHRVHPGLMSQAGRRPGDEDPYGGPGYFIEHEGSRDDARRHFRGSLCMAATGKENRLGSQFYITHFPTSHLNTKHLVIGRVLDGQPHVEAMRGGERVDLVRITRRRPHDYAIDVQMENGSTVPRSVWKAMQSAPDQSSELP